MAVDRELKTQNRPAIKGISPGSIFRPRCVCVNVCGVHVCIGTWMCDSWAYLPEMMAWGVAGGRGLQQQLRVHVLNCKLRRKEHWGEQEDSEAPKLARLCCPYCLIIQGDKPPPSRSCLPSSSISWGSKYFKHVFFVGNSRSNHHSSQNVLGLGHFWFEVFRLKYSLGTVAVERVMGIMKIE